MQEVGRLRSTHRFVNLLTDWQSTAIHPLWVHVDQEIHASFSVNDLSTEGVAVLYNTYKTNKKEY